VRSSLHEFGAIILVVLASGGLGGCHRLHSGSPRSAAVTPTGEPAVTPPQDAAWRSRAVVLHVDPGNSVTKRRSESAFTPRTSHASVDGQSSSLRVQVAALSHTVSIKKPLVEQQLREMGLVVIGIKHSKLHQPNSFNVLVEDVTYVEEAERKNNWDPVVCTLTPTIHVRVISANERKTFQAAPITVRSVGPLSSDAAENYGRKLSLARIELGKQLVDWLAARLPLSPATQESSTAPNPAVNRPIPKDKVTPPVLSGKSMTSASGAHS